MNLTVEWVHFGDFVQGPGSSDDYKPVIRVDALRKWMQEMKREEIARTANDDRIMLLDDLLAKLPEA